MEANKDSNFEKCGEILIDKRTKDKETKTYVFHCTYCDIKCGQLEKFYMHLAEVHLNAIDYILAEDEIKCEFEAEEVQFGTIVDIKGAKMENLKIDNKYQNHYESKSASADLRNEMILSGIENYEIEKELQGIPEIQGHITPNHLYEETHDMIIREIKCELMQDSKEEQGYTLKSKTKFNNTQMDYIYDTSPEDDFSDKDDYPCGDLKMKMSQSRKAKSDRQKLKNSGKAYTTLNGKLISARKVKKDINITRKHMRCKRRWKKIDHSKLPIIIEMYKKNEILWQVNDIAFGILPKRNETFAKMAEDLNSDHNFDKDLYELQDYIDYINYTFQKDREQELKCEPDKTEFKPSSKYYNELSFLSDSQGPFKCSNCGEIIKKYDLYHIHLAEHNGSIPFQCRLCEMGFHKFDNYVRHISRHLGINSYHCDVCGKGYPFKSELEWHLTSHTGVKPFLCPICGAGFRARHGYDNHIRRHEERFRYECHICKRGFNHLCKLNTHIKSHLNIRDIICNVCGKGFTAAKYLHRHKLIHEEEKRYKCNVCDKAFAQDSGLRAHRKQHQPYATIAENKKIIK